MALSSQQQKLDVHKLLADLKACGRARNLDWGRQLHAQVVESGHSSDHVATALVNMYAKCGSMVQARQLFNSIKCPDTVPWTVLILGYVDNGQSTIALDLFARMQNVGTSPDSVTFVAALKACTALAVNGSSGECMNRGKDIHNLIVECGCDSDLYVQTTLIDLYSKCGCIEDARQVFDRMEHPNVVSWNALVLGYADNGQALTALELLAKMKNRNSAPDSVTFMAALKACTSLAVTGASRDECRNRGNAVYDLAVENSCGSDIYVQSTLIDLYAKCGSSAEARRVFDSMKHPNVVSWTALILGYAECGESSIALDLFTRMKAEGPAPNCVTFLAALKACALLGALEFGRTVHSDIKANDLNLNVVLVNCLVDFYAKCGCLVEAQKLFDSHARIRNVITWTALLAGFSSCGDHESVFRLFEGMQDAGFRPDSVTFLSILTCCSHAGLVEKGKECFDAMSAEYGLDPAVEHYTCMVDIFGRANRLDDAMALLQRMPYSTQDDATWMTVLGACRRWKNLEIGRLAFQSLIDFTFRDAACLLMGQIYRSRGMLQEQEMVMNMRSKLTELRMPSESSWTNEGGQVHRFLVE